MANLPTAKQTIVWSDDLTKASITCRISQKYAHKLLQDHFKQMTEVRGGWTFYHDYTDEQAHHYTVSNPFYQAIHALQEAKVPTDDRWVMNPDGTTVKVS